MSIDLSKFAKTQFYAGPPDEATPDRLLWKAWYGHTMEVKNIDGDPIAVMCHGQTEWRASIDPEDIVKSIDAALENACDLGRIANESNDE